MVRLRLLFKRKKWLAIKIAFTVHFLVVIFTLMRSFLNKKNSSHLVRLHTILGELPSFRSGATENPYSIISKTDVTIVAGFFDIGNVKKGIEYTPADYLKWMRILERISNPLIIFFDEKLRYMKKFRTLRVREPSYMTVIKFLKRDTVWPFTLKPKIKRLFENSSYLEHEPNTVNVDYSCMRHAKYDLMAKAIQKNAFNTRYYAWLDISLFHNIADYRPNRFSINIPPNFDETKVAYAYSHEPGTTKDPRTIVEGNLVWTSGAFFLATSAVMSGWVRQYRYYAESMLKAGWISGDEQVLYYMSQQEKVGTTGVEVQAYKADGRVYPPYHLAYLCSSLDHCEYNRTCEV